MNFIVTHQKAPWPAGIEVGDVVAFPGDVVPGWAVGKCKAADVAAAEAQVQVDIARSALEAAEAHQASVGTWAAAEAAQITA